MPLHHSPYVDDFSLLPGRLGIFGGSFDPVQRAHTSIASAAMSQARLDGVVFVPAKQNPLKSISTSADAKARLDMLELALKDEKRFWISTIELERESEELSYTVTTLTQIRSALRQEQELHLIIGSDNLSTLHRWKNVSGIFSICKSIITVNREQNFLPDFYGLKGLDRDQQEHLQRNFVNVPALRISSTDIRRSIAFGETLLESIHPEVAKYIDQHRLYQK